MTLEKNIGGALLKAGKEHGDKKAFITPGGDLTHKNLGGYVARLAILMSSRGVGRGSCVAIKANDPRVIVMGIGACALLGAAWTNGGDRYVYLIDEHVTHELTMEPPRPGTTPKHATIVVDPRELEKVNVTGSETFPGYADDDQVSRFGFSSGTTGQRKAVCLTVAIEWRQVSRQYTVPDDGSDIVSFSLFPPMSGAGIGQRMFTLLSGGTVVEGWMPDLLKAGKINMIKGSPAQLSKLIQDFDKAGITTKMPLAVSAGGRISDELMRNLRNRFQRTVNAYASTEMGGVGTYQHAEREDYDGRLEPRSDISLQIVDDEGNPVPDGEIGHLRVKFDVGMPKYLDSTLSEQAFKDGWFYPGDLAKLLEDGCFLIEGRGDDATNLGGIKVNLLRYDDFVQAQPSVDDGYAFVKTDAMGVGKLNLIVRFKAGSDKLDAAKALLQAISEEKQLTTPPVAIYASDEVPRTDTGKAAKHLAVSLTETMEPVVITMRRNQALSGRA